jgi:uncharacterized membrane protein YsdA (DUF1294 family)
MDTVLLTILLVLLVINIISFFVVVIDKEKSRRGSQRISEGALFFWAAFFGGIGIYLGMFTVRHKTRKWYFYLGIPLMVIQNLCLLFLLYKFIEQIN